jgi:hypothetical protein
MVGTSGRSGLRAVPVTATALALPSRMWGRSEPMPSIIIWIWPEIRSVIACAIAR